MSGLRLHPDDFRDLVEQFTINIASKLEELFSKQHTISSMQILTIKDVAKILNKDKTTVLRYIEKGLIKAKKKGKDWIITQQSLIDYINE